MYRILSYFDRPCGMDGRMVIILSIWFAGMAAATNTLFDFVDYADYLENFRLDRQMEAMKMYPFGTKYHDMQATPNQLTIGLDPGLDFQIPFYGVVYSSCWISTHGHVAFSTLASSPPVYYSSVRWPNTHYPSYDDPPFVAPFYGKVDFRANNPEEKLSRLFYRQLRRTGRNDIKSIITDKMLDHIGSHVRSAVVGSSQFEAQHGIVVTWYKVGYAGANCELHRDPAKDLCNRNTFQLALVTDNINTFTVINYFNMTWVGSSSQGCNPRTGRQSALYSHCKPAQAGFNAGEARQFTHLPHSFTHKILDLDKLGATQVQGRYVFKVSDDFIVRGGCTSDTNLGTQWSISAHPVVGSMLGGEEIDISGPCFTSPERIQCRFNDVETVGWEDEANPLVAHCTVPQMNHVGPVKLGVSVDGVNFHYDTSFTIAEMSHLGERVRVQVPDDNWKDPETITLYWESRDLSLVDTDNVEIKLFGYREVEGADLQKIVELHTIATAERNDGYHTLTTAEHRCSLPKADKVCPQYDVGMFEISLMDSNPQSPRRIYSRIIPLAWFIRKELENQYGSRWAFEKCRVWNSRDVKQHTWPDTLWPCPCTLQQAKADFGRFQPDPTCDVNNPESKSCPRHRTAIHCVISVQVTDLGAGSRCCYDSSGWLTYSGDSPEGSKPDRSHPWGMAPYSSAPYIPMLSHAVHDIAPYYYCCAFQTDDYACFTYYLSLRRTADCKTYKSPGHAAAFGDPHFRTFDGTVYTFNGRGEFWLIKVPWFSLQARLEQPPKQTWGAPPATIITALALQYGSGSVVEVQLSRHQAANSSSLRVFRDGVQLQLNSPKLTWYDFADFIIVRHTVMSKGLPSNITIITRTGVAVQVAAKNGLLQTIVVVTPDFFDVTLGLLGTWNGNFGDDLRPQDGGAPVSPTNLPQVHNNFGWTWSITESQSRFTYRADLTYEYYRNKTFVPSFSDQAPPASPGVSSAHLDAVCGQNFPCRYDFANTANENIAKEDLAIQAWVAKLRSSALPETTCGWLNVPNSVKRAPVSYKAGSVVIIEGCRHGYSLKGPVQYQCVDNGDGTAHWNPSVSTICIDESHALESQTKMAYAVGIPVGILFVILVIGLLACCCYIHRKRKMNAAMKAELERGIDRTNDEFSDFRSIPAKPYRVPRPNIRVADVDDASIRSQRQHMHVTRAESNPSIEGDDTLSKSGSADQVDWIPMKKPRAHLNDSEASETSRKKPPYDYPQISQNSTERKRPYQYPKNIDPLTAREKALIEQKAKEHNLDFMT